MDDRRWLNAYQPRIPLEVQACIIEALDRNFEFPFFNYLKEYRTLLSCCLVCRAWLRTSQRILFTCVFLPSARHFDKLRALHGTAWGPHPSHLLKHIRCISFRYDHRSHKLGEVIACLAMMPLPQLERLELITYATGQVSFPLHHSLVVYASKLTNIRVLYLLGFSFNNFFELRRFVDIFRGLDRLECNGLRCGADKLGNFRSPYWIRSRGPKTVKLVPYSRQPFESDDIPEDPTMFWIAARQQGHLTPLPSLTTIYPALTSDVVEVLVGIRRILYDEDTLHWSLIDKTCQQWELHSSTHYTSFQFSFHHRPGPEPAQTTIRPVFDSSEVLSVQFRVFAEKEPDQVQLQRLEDLLSKLGNLEELRLEVHQRSNTIPSPEKQMGVGQLYAEYLPLTRRRCNLKITIRDGGSVDWKHLFDEETDELDKTDYRNLGTQTATTQPARTMWSSNSSISLSPILLPSQSAPLVPSPPVSSIHSPSSSPDHSSAPNPIHLSMYTLPPFPSLYPISDSPPELLPNPAFPTFNSSTIWPHIQPPQPPHPRLIDKNGNTHGPMEYDETAVGLCGILDV